MKVNIYYKSAIALLWFILNGTLALAANTITVQGVMRDSAGNLIDYSSPLGPGVGDIKAVFYHGTLCTSAIPGDALLVGCDPGAIGNEVIYPFQIKAGAFSFSLEPTAGTLALMAANPTGWYVKIRGIFDGAPVGEFLIPLDSVPFAKIAEVAATVSNSAVSGNSIIAAINATDAGDTKIDADRLPSISGSTILSGTIGGSTAINTTGTIDSGAISSTSTVSGAGLLSSILGSAATPAIRFSSDPNTGIYSSGADAIDFATNGSNRMSINSSGNVGIGTTLPSAQFHILQASAGTTPQIIRAASSPTTPALEILNSAGTPISSIGFTGGASFTNEVFNSAHFKGTSFRSPLGSAATPGFTNFGNTNTGLFFPSVTSAAISANGSESIRFDSSGNVGIGTTSPVSKLHLGAAPTATANYGLLSLGSGAFDGSTPGYFGTGSSSNSSGTVIAINAASGYGGDLANFEVAGASKLKVDASGNTTIQGTSNTAPNQVADSNSSLLTKSGFEELAGYYPTGSGTRTISIGNSRNANYFWTNYTISTKGGVVPFTYQTPGTSRGRMKMTFVTAASPHIFFSYDLVHYAYGNVSTGGSWNADIRRSPDSGSAWVGRTVTTGTPTVTANEVITGSRGSQLTVRDTGSVTTAVVFKSVGTRLPSTGEVFTVTGGSFTISSGNSWGGTPSDAAAAYTMLLIPAVGLFIPSTMPDGVLYISGHYIN